MRTSAVHDSAERCAPDASTHASAIDERTSETRESVPAVGPLRVLLIEENAITRRLARLALETNGIAVLEAGNGAIALSLLGASPVDLVLQDLVLPDMDGFELVARMRALPGGAEIPIVAISGLLTKLEEARVSAVGFDDVISKPVEPAHLLQIVRAHLPTDEPREIEIGCGRRLLVVDDDPVQRKLLCFRLRRMGFETTTAADGVEALSLARKVVPDAIISDVMMPGLDGFGLCVAIREDPVLARTPLLLLTNSYIEEVERELARNAGASGFVVRTPGMREVADALRESLSASPRVRPSSVPAADLEGAWSRRVMSQLERQVSLNAGIAQRCATLSAELSILSGISDALARQKHIDEALVDVLATCFDAGGISSSALYLSGDGRIVLHKFGAWGQSDDEHIRTFFGRPDLLVRVMAGGKTVRIPSDPGAEEVTAILSGVGMVSAIIVPVHRRGEVVGALLMGSRTRDLEQEDRLFFTEGVATQISQALALSHSFAEKDESERRSREQAAVLRSILESIAEGVVVTNRDGEVVIWNLAAEGILRKGAITVPAPDWTEHYGLCLPETLEPVPPERSPFLRAMAGDSVDSMEMLLRDEAVPQGRHISISARPLKEDDVVIGAVGVLRDVTVERATQTQLMVTDRLASVGMLAAGVAHEINNPLAAVLGNLEVALEKLAERGADPELHDDLAEMAAALRDARDGASRIRQIVRDLKVFSRDEKEKLGPVDVHRVLDLALRTASNEVRHRARVVRHYGTVPRVDGNESRLGQVFLNLIVNAAQAIPDGHADENEIRITTREGAEGRVLIDIADTGTGIAPDALKRLFTPFFTTKPVGIGTGLGLSICHRLVAAAGGEITVESALGKGTVFHVALRPSAGADIVFTPAPVRSQPATRRGRVLVVDDERAVVDVVKRILSAEHDCIGVSNGKEALALILSREFDVIFCDLMMPVMTGMDLHAELAIAAPEASSKMIFLTGGAFTARARAFLSEIKNRRIEKPFDAGTLKAVVNARLTDSATGERPKAG